MSEHSEANEDFRLSVAKEIAFISGAIEIKNVVNYPHSCFPVCIGDDGGFCFFKCELPITGTGEIIDIGYWYELSQCDTALVTGKKLVQRGDQFTWFFETQWYENGDFSLEEDIMVYEFKRLIKQ